MNDLISRKTAQETLQNARVMVMGMRFGQTVLYEYARQCRETMISALDTVEPADAEYVKHGSWIPAGKTERGTNILMCSCCKKKRKGISKSNYCRDCGARMDLPDISQETLDAMIEIGKDAHFMVLDDETYEQDSYWPKENPFINKKSKETSE